MLSRVADSLYWMSRYLERAENSARQLDVAMSQMLDTGGVSAELRWEHLLAALGRPSGLYFRGDAEAMAHTMIFDPLTPSSITYCINAARENARQVREEISTEQWQRLNRLYHQMHSPNVQERFEGSLTDALTTVLDGIHLFEGVGSSTMIHGQGWQFIRLGRYLERAYSTATMLEAAIPDLTMAHERDYSAYQYLDLIGLLRSCTAFEAYCQVYMADIVPDQILEFLVLNRDFPHSIRYAVDSIRFAVDSIQRHGGRRAADLGAAVGKLHAMLEYSSIGEILGDPAAFLNSVREQCLRIHDSIYRAYVQYSIQSALTV